MRIAILTTLIGALLVSASAFAGGGSHSGYYVARWTSCETYNSQQSFRESSALNGEARNWVLSQCYASSTDYRDRQDCQINLRCWSENSPGYPQPQPPYNPPYQPPYNPGNPDYPSYPGTPPCPTPGYPPYQPPYNPPHEDLRPTVCTTQSYDRTFSLPGRGVEATRRRVISLCQQSPYTDARDCFQNARCE